MPSPRHTTLSSFANSVLSVVKNVTSRSHLPRLPNFTLLPLLLLTACSPSPDSSTSTLRIGNGAEPRSLDPHTATSIPDAHIINALFEGLLSEATDGSSTIVAGIASSWKISDDLTTFTFTLRPEARWSDSTPITAQTFLDSFERLLNPAFSAQNAEHLFDIANAEAYHHGTLKTFDQVGLAAPSAHTLVITLAEPTPVFLQKLRHFSWFPVPTHFIDQKGDRYDIANPWASSPDLVSNGPYTLDAWQRNQRISLARNMTYWDASAVSIERLEFFPLENTQSEYRAFLAGQLDLTEEIPAELRDQDLPTARSDSTLATSYLLLNNESPAFADPAIRQALSAAIDRQKLIKSITKTGVPATRFTPAAMPHYPLGPLAAPMLAPLSDSQRAALQAHSPLRLVVSNRDTSIAVAEALQDMWQRRLGIEVRIQNMEFKTFLSQLEAGNYDISYLAWHGDYIDPLTFLGIWQSDSLYNRARWKNETYDQLLAASATQADPELRLETLRKAETLLMDQMPIIPLFWKTKDYLISPNVKNWPASLTDTRSYKNIQLKR